jgi:hypothetical protein
VCDESICIVATHFDPAPFLPCTSEIACPAWLRCNADTKEWFFNRGLAKEHHELIEQAVL